MRSDGIPAWSIKFPNLITVLDQWTTVVYLLLTPCRPEAYVRSQISFSILRLRDYIAPDFTHESDVLNNTLQYPSYLRKQFYLKSCKVVVEVGNYCK